MTATTGPNPEQVRKALDNVLRAYDVASIDAEVGSDGHATITLTAYPRRHRNVEERLDALAGTVEAIREIAEAPINEFETETRRLEMIHKLAETT